MRPLKLSGLFIRRNTYIVMRSIKSVCTAAVLSLLFSGVLAHAVPVSGTVTDKTTNKPSAGDKVELTLPPTPLRDMVSALARKVDAGMSVVGNVVYVGPTDSAKKLRTLVELRNDIGLGRAHGWRLDVGYD